MEAKSMNSFEDRQNMKNKTSCAIVVTSIFDNLWIERISKEIIIRNNKKWRNRIYNYNI